MRKFIVSLANRPALKESFSDLYSDPEFEVIDHPICIKNKLLNFLYRAHMSKKLNDYFYLPFKSIWKRFYFIDGIDWDLYKEKYLIIVDSALVWYSAEYLNKVRRGHNIKVILLLFNPMNILQSNKTFMDIYNRVNFDLKLCTFDVRDADEFDCKQTYSIYSKLNFNYCDPCYDIVYLGMDKGRYKKILECYNLAKESGLTVDFSIINCQEDAANREPGIKYIKEVPYIDYLDLVNKSKAILEIVQKGQEGITLRTFEAIVYGKHLFTNNQHVKLMPFYNPKYIHLFEDIKDIDFTPITENFSVDYEYINSFSPINLKREITQYLN